MWISNPLVGWKCSECNGYVVLNAQRDGEYCPLCGYHHKRELMTLLFKGKCQDGRIRYVKAKTSTEVFMKYTDVIEVDHVI